MAPLCWGIADIIWALDEWFFNVNPEESKLLMSIYTLPSILVFISIAHYFVMERNRWNFFQILTDLFAVLSALMGFVFIVFFFKEFKLEYLFEYESLMNFVSLVFDMMSLTLVISIVFSSHSIKRPMFLKVLISGIVAYAFADSMYVYQVFNGFYMPNTLVDVLYSGALLLIGGTGLFINEEVYAQLFAKPSQVKPLHSINRLLLLIVISVVTLSLRGFQLDVFMFFLIILACQQIASAAIQQFAFKESLIQEKNEMNHLLEEKVEQRTKELQLSNEKLENLTKKDAITGLFNRKYFLDLVDDWIHKSDGVRQVSVILIDVNRFKLVNETYGHDVGDQLLTILGIRMEKLMDSNRVLARLSGDEFGIACRDHIKEELEFLMMQIFKLCNEPIQVAPYIVHVTFNAGVAQYPVDALERLTLLKHADIALSHAKTKKNSRYAFFDEFSSAQIKRRNRIEIALKHANIDQEFRVVYQPQFDVTGKRLLGMEALLRWESKSLGVVSPSEFIPIAEDCGEIIQLGDWVMEMAFKQVKIWNDLYNANFSMGINISPLQLDGERLVHRLEYLIEKYQVLPKWIDLEVTESSAMKGETFIEEMFVVLSSIGVIISIDDFGTGYSSLSYLKRFNIDYLKIAKPLIDLIAYDFVDEQIVRAIIMMAKALGLKTIAEGVETTLQRDILVELGCNEIQGYLYGRPVSSEEFEVLYLNRGGNEPT